VELVGISDIHAHGTSDLAPKQAFKSELLNLSTLLPPYCQHPKLAATAGEFTAPLLFQFSEASLHELSMRGTGI